MTKAPKCRKLFTATTEKEGSTMWWIIGIGLAFIGAIFGAAKKTK
ncbi:MAG: hypothetical protein QM689_08750 [Oscillospiraceae bacterium]